MADAPDLAPRPEPARDPPDFVRSPDPVAEAAARLVHAVRAVQRERATVRLAIPGGSALAALGPARVALGAVWRHVRLCWVDERCVPFADPASNRGSAYRSGALDAAHPPAAELPLWRDDETPAAALRRVASALRRDFAGGLDVLLLGMGEDGHVASLFPHVHPDPAADVVWVPDSPKPPAQRITLTLRSLRTARHGVLLATGTSKREAIARLLRRDPALPANALRGLVVVSDDTASGPPAGPPEEAR